MITRTLYLLTFAGGLTAALVSGCGGKVIVDGVGNEGGQGGQESGNSSVSDGEGGASTCGFPAPSGAVEICGPSSSSSGGPDVCSPVFCDQAGNIYQINCTGTNCLCSFLSADGRPGSSCSCTLQSSCMSAIPCCPFVQ